ncbi:hypothetical protein NDU88_002427 [Pleurodeles waltl]|uniref:Uncharacterized protein n=1 Tax=Pleurodeles waltl TaxID=8319 RepID=A0AAV7WQ60_PLEWA|nr:hypothetical protein NDU88_002427 [Pleurodeles waltl]
MQWSRAPFHLAARAISDPVGSVAGQGALGPGTESFVARPRVDGAVGRTTPFTLRTSEGAGGAAWAY